MEEAVEVVAAAAVGATDRIQCQPKNAAARLAGKPDLAWRRFIHAMESESEPLTEPRDLESQAATRLESLVS